MDSILLMLGRSEDQEAALLKLIDEQQDPESPNYQQWLTPEEFGVRFGPSDSDILTVTDWLKAQGFNVVEVSKGRTFIEFSGTARQVARAFHTSIHRYHVNGHNHVANSSDPDIPAALGPVVAGIVSLNDFQLRPQSVVHPEVMVGQVAPGESDGNGPAVTFGSGSHALGPADYAVIYNINPALQSGTNGSGSSIAVVGRTNINLADVNDFRSLFALPSNPPQIVLNGANPGNLGGGEEIEALLDVSWSGATAPNATVKFVVSKSTSSSDGIILSEQYIVNNNVADIMTMSFGSCEAAYSSATANAMSTIAQQAAAQGITIFVSSGDSGSAGCDSPTSARATGPLSVNILSSNAYTVAVGGTQFADTTNPSAYWRSSNGSGYGSALSYIPEVVWNESGSNLYASGGGVSMFYARPSWQTGVAGLPADAFRHVPDVSLTAAGHDGYLVCAHRSCVPNSAGQISFNIVGGTSASSPAFAGIMALVKQKAGARQGQAAYTFYRLAAQNPSACNGSSATLPASNCIFNDTTTGNNAVPGVPGYGTPSASYQAGAGYDSATGLGSVNVTNLVNAWTGSSSTPSPRATSTSLTITPATSNQGTPVTVGVSVSPAAATGSVTLTTSGGATVGTWPLNSGSVTAVINSLPVGSYTVTARYSGDSTYASSVSAPISVTVTTASTASNLTLSPTSLSFGAVTTGTSSTPQTISLAISRTATNGFVPISSISLTGTNPGDFSQSNNCGTSLFTGITCTISVTFRPTAGGPRSASVTIQADTTLNVPLSGTGGGSSGSPGVSLTATSLNFNGVNIGTPSAPQGFTITNTGSAALSISGISITGANSGDFKQSNNCPGTLSTSASCGVTVTFTPSAAGPRSAAVTINDSAPGSPHSVTLSGSGNSTGSARASFSATSLTFGNQSVGSTSVGQTVIFTSTGSTSLTISSITVTGANAGDFRQSNNCPAALSAGSSCSITVTFVPTATGTRSAAVAIADGAGGHSITLTGTGASAVAGGLVLSPSSITFPATPAGRSSATQWIQVKNSGSNSINIFTVSLSGANAREFGGSTGCWGALGPGAVCSIGVLFSPLSAGSKSALLQVLNDGPGGPQSITLTGVGQ
jgi:hypothetical protein